MAPKKNQMYFAANPQTPHDRKLINYQVNDVNLRFNTDAGVFSKLRVDYGSCVLIKELAKLKLSAGDILDVGTGYGPLGLFAAKFWPQKTVEMVDVNERGLDLARENASLNHIGNVNIHTSDVYEQVAGEQFSLIITNPPIRAGKKVVSSILAGALAYLAADGQLLVVIQKKQGEPSARKLLTKVYGNCTILARDKGYYILQARKK